MTYPEFIKSLTKEQRKCHEEALFEVMKSEHRRYQETVALKKEIMLLLYALNFEPYSSVEELSSAVRATVERLQETPAAGEAADAVPRTTTAQEPYAKRVNTVCHSPCEGNQGHHPKQRQAD